MRVLIPILAVAGSLVLAGSASADPTATGPSGTQAFGDAQVNTATAPTSRSYLVTNTGTDPVWVVSSTLTGADVAQFELTGTCATRTQANPLTAGQTCTVIVGFKPTTTGAKSVTLTTVTNGPTFTTGAITGFGRKLSAVTPVSYGDRHVGTSAMRVIRITNEGAEDYPLGAVASSLNQWVKGTDGCGSKTLVAGASCDVELTFAPTSGGVKTGFLTIVGHKPHLVALEGTGTEAAAGVSPSTADVTGGPQAFTVRNGGNEALKMGTASVGNGFVLTADACSGTSVAPGATCVVSVARDGSAGWRSAALQLPGANFDTVVARVTGRVGLGADSDPFAGTFSFAGLPLARLTGDGSDNLGAALSSGACDVNGDGYDDILSGASLWSVTPAESSWEGAAYVTFGGSRFGSSDLAATAAGSTIRIEGEKVRAQTGTGLGCAGDVNGDGIDDLVIGAWAYEYDGRPAGTGAPRGAAYVVFGAKDLASAGPLDLGLLGTRGYRIVAPNADKYDHFGYQVAGVGDLNGDGRDDLAVMANTADSSDTTPARTSNGRVSIIAGKASTATQTVPDGVLATYIGATPGQLGIVTAAGDVNGDGTDDVAIGAYTNVVFGRSTASGATYVVSGAKRGAVDLGDPASAVLSVGGAFAGHRLGIGVASLGDVNGDGFDDLLVGADSTAAANSDAAYVIFGAASGAMLDTAALGTRGYRILGAPGSAAGYAVASAGDANHDGVGDVLIGGTGSGTNGRAWIVYGVKDISTLPANNAGGASALVPANLSDSTRYISLADLGERGTSLSGVTAGERFGRQVAYVGDVDGNGVDDLAVGADMALRYGRTRAGEVTVALLAGPVPAAPPVEQPVATPTPIATATPTPLPAQPKPAVKVTPTITYRALRADTKGRVSFTVRCAGVTVTCPGKATLTLAGVKRSVSFSKASLVKVTLTAKQRKSLARHSRLKAKLTLKVTIDGKSTTRVLNISVRKAKA